MLVLPPPNDGYVLFFCQRKANNPPGCIFGAAEAFLWSPTDPSNIEMTIAVPQALPGADDIFCSGTAWTSSGKAFFAGGTNLVEDCGDGVEPDPPWGHNHAWIFDNRDYVRGTPPYPAFQLTNAFLKPRWYPTVLQTGDDRYMVLGHLGKPDSAIPGEQTARTRERATWNAGSSQLTWESTTQDFYNYVLSGTNCGVLPEPTSLGDYPRIHQLANGLAVFCRNRGYVLDFNKCPLVAENERFVPLDWGTPQPQAESNSTVHYVDLRDGVGSEVEWIVSIAGADEEAGCDGPGGDLLIESNEVVFMNDPIPNAVWTSLPSLKRSRTEANAIVGLNGEILVFGGYGRNPAGDLVGRMKPELFRPSFEPGFLFGPSLASTEWTQLCPMAHPHAYHSVAALLEDGRIVMAGGDYPCDGPTLDEGAQAMEIFSPPSLFGGSRPRINVLSATELEYSIPPVVIHELSIDVLLQGGNTGEFRVALTRAASVTHAFDNNQRYAVLQVNEALSTFVEPPSVSTLKVFHPAESQVNAVPPGYYLLTVVNADGRPAPAKWIRMVPP
jgi:hypothetical protein